MEESKRDMILEAARELFFHYGFKKTTMQDIAGKAGIAVGTLYNLFKNKEEVVAACAASCKKEGIGKMEEMASSSMAPDEKIRQIIMAKNVSLYETFKETPHGLELVTVVIPQAKDIFEELFEREREVITSVMNEGVKEGLFDIEDTAGTAALFLSAFSSYCPPHGLSLTEDEVKRGTRELTELLLKGMYKR